MTGLISERLNEGRSGPIFYPYSQLVAAVNEAYRFFVVLTLGLETTKLWNVAPNTPFFHMLQFFPDWIVCLRITDTLGNKVRPATLDDLTCLDSQWTASPGNPVRYCPLGCDFIGIYHQPTTEVALYVAYVYSPPPLVNATDVPLIPGEYHPALVDYGVYCCRQVEGAQELEKSLVFFNRFVDGAQRYAAYVRARNIGSRYDKVPFELESFDRSDLMNAAKRNAGTQSPEPAGVSKSPV